MNEYEKLLHDNYKIDKNVMDFVEAAEKEIDEQLQTFDAVRAYNNYKVLSAFKRTEVANRHFAGTTGYGYSDIGRDKLGELFAEIFGAEAAIVTPNISSGTNAIAIALFGLLRPLDKMLSITGRPYDTLINVIGCDEGNKTTNASLVDYAIRYEEVGLDVVGCIDIGRIMDILHLIQDIKIVYIQRSRGYAKRPAITINEIEHVCHIIKARFPDVMIVVDNCYGEFTETREPTEVGADLMIGSLIKNPGAGIAPTGAYFAGTQKAIDLLAERLTCPGIGAEIGSYAYGYLPYYQGIYLAPSVVCNAMKGAVLAAYVFSKTGKEVYPLFDAKRSDITQMICFDTENELIEFVRNVQKASPVDSNVVPYPWDMPGYSDQVIMAAGTFIQGNSIEMSADAPIKSPYCAYFQGGLTIEQIKLAIMLSLQNIL